MCRAVRSAIEERFAAFRALEGAERNISADMGDVRAAEPGMSGSILREDVVLWRSLRRERRERISDLSLSISLEMRINWVRLTKTFFWRSLDVRRREIFRRSRNSLISASVAFARIVWTSNRRLLSVSPVRRWTLLVHGNHLHCSALNPRSLNASRSTSKSIPCATIVAFRARVPGSWLRSGMTGSAGASPLSPILM